MYRDMAYRRKQRARHIRRKKRIIREQHDYWVYLHEGSLDKGKIHCSCPMCRRKSYDEMKMQDRRNMDRLYASANQDEGEIE